MSESYSAKLKEAIPLSRAAQALGLQIKPAGRQDCPFCKYKQSLSTRDDRTYVCFHCGKSGTVIDLVQDGGFASSTQEALKILRPMFDGSFSALYHERSSNLQMVFSLYTQQNAPAIEYLHNRGIHKALEEYWVGYAPSPKFLQQNGISPKTVQDCGISTTDRPSWEILNNHIVFPVWGAGGDLLHLQGRSLEPDPKTRWMGTTNFKPRVDECLFNAHRLDYWKVNPPEGSSPYVWLCEGLTDTYSLLNIGEPAVGTLGNHFDLSRYSNQLSGMSIIYCGDNDQYALGTSQAGQYKSWCKMLPGLVRLYQQTQDLQIFCAMPPKSSGKDMNDFLDYIEWDVDEFYEWAATAQPIEEVVFNHYQSEESSWELIRECVGVKRHPQHVEKLRKLILNRGDWIDYLLNLPSL